MKVCVIPARGGSRRIPRKNIRDFHGVPMIARSIATALASSSIDRVVVSTDDEEIADIARTAGAEVPFMRSADLSDDMTGTLAVLVDALERIEAERDAPLDALLCLYATAPFVRPEDLDRAWVQLVDSKADYVFAGVEFAYPIQRALRRSGDRVELFYPEHTGTRSQDLEPAYHDAGQFYWCRPEALRAGRALLGPTAAMYRLDRARAQDIDTPDDWAFAEKLYRLLEQDEGS
ncbi:pseudaminic acid cytidylyltransferase [Stappia sp. ES.058]|uniref:pseudaminic acid cytidylyltransferase n=1 Tax=Stappia sp. ES.058 TaxID=1881061 RepID=UPI00087D75CF|nr:pseudaminic acid cytidylyltransferase [Stappia sp. ES.058]SDT95031.1 N-acylneuraminate cytidylyltransferase [Stappia sp. ES.058]